MLSHCGFSGGAKHSAAISLVHKPTSSDRPTSGPPQLRPDVIQPLLQALELLEHPPDGFVQGVPVCGVVLDLAVLLALALPLTPDLLVLLVLIVGLPALRAVAPSGRFPVLFVLLAGGAAGVAAAAAGAALLLAAHLELLVALLHALETLLRILRATVLVRVHPLGELPVGVVQVLLGGIRGKPEVGVVGRIGHLLQLRLLALVGPGA
mmetsp:Transcript_110860/g.345526  ORF Transcript_110860/g.345526 Transcript_110860/m.345526 type:complete len:208 (-) Transcript_110860:194-817(-)